MNDLQTQAQNLDAADAIGHLKTQFSLPQGLVYLDGNSLGPLPLSAKARALEVVNQQWGQDLIASWNKHQWIDLPKIIGNKIAPLLGAQADTVVCCDSISVNLFKLLSAALDLSASKDSNTNTLRNPPRNPLRNKILSQKDNFPTDLYMAQGLSELVGPERCELMSVVPEEISNIIKQHGNEIAVLMLTQVNFRNGDIHDIQAITSLAHEHGILVIWDLAHSAGVLPLDLEKWQVDFAVGCTYKYLNGGPGAPGFAYVAPQHQAALRQPLSGWMGHKAPFAFSHDYEKAQGIEHLLCGTPSIISMSILDAALDIFEGVSIFDIRKKSIALNNFFQEALADLCKDTSLSEFTLACKSKASERGSQISYQHPQAYEICQALIAHKVVADFRAPNILRIGFSPLFLSFADVLQAAQTLSVILKEEIYTHAKFSLRQAVT